MAETLAYAYHKQSGVDVRVARIFNTYGPRMHANDGRVVSNFVIQALEDKPITIYGSGEQTRSFQVVIEVIWQPDIIIIILLSVCLRPGGWTGGSHGQRLHPTCQHRQP